MKKILKILFIVAAVVTILGYVGLTPFEKHGSEDNIIEGSNTIADSNVIHVIFF